MGFATNLQQRIAELFISVVVEKDPQVAEVLQEKLRAVCCAT